MQLPRVALLAAAAIPALARAISLPAADPNAEIEAGATGTPVARAPSPVEIVVASFQEKVEWIVDVQNQMTPKASLRLYCKSPDNTDPRCIHLENKGTEEFVYLTHIVDNYDALADMTLFLVGSTNSSDYNGIRPRAMKYVVSKIATPEARELVDGAQFPLNMNWGKPLPWRPDFDIKSFHTHVGGKAVPLCRPKYTPLSAWFEHFVHANTTHTKCAGRSEKGIFAVKRDRIHVYPKQVYQDLIDEIVSCNSNAFTAGHYMERSWAPMFSSCKGESPRYDPNDPAHFRQPSE